MQLVQQIQYAQSPILNQENISSYPHQTYFLFINSKSGGGWGKRYFTLCAKQITFKFQRSKLKKNVNINLYSNLSTVGSDQNNPNEQKPFYKKNQKTSNINTNQKGNIFVRVQFYDLTKSQDRKTGIKSVKKHTISSPYADSTRVIICGGDGTILWGVQQLIKGGVDIQKVIFGTIPIGTGNDFSRSIGWGSKPVQFSQDSLKGLLKILKKWIVASTTYFDIWDIQIQTHPQGRIYMAQNKSQVLYMQKTFKSSFCNYSGIGIDARVAYNMQLYRGNSVMMNMIVYACVGACYLFKKARSITKTIETFEEYRQKQEALRNFQDSPHKQHHMTEKELKSQRRDSESTNYQMTDQLGSQKIIKRYIIKSRDQNGNQITIDDSYKALVCLNCTSYMAGNRNVWKTTKPASKLTPIKQFTGQKYNDGKIQFVAFKNELDMALQNILRRSYKVAQGSGPFYIQAKDNIINQQTFVHIDGQSFKIIGLKSIYICKSNKVINGKIRILVDQQQQS